MEDEETQHNNLSVLHLNLPPPDQADALLGFFSHGATNPADHLLLPNYPPPLIHNTSSFMAAPDMCPPSHVDPAHALIINSNVGVMGGKRRKMMNKLGESVAILEKPARDVIHVRAKRGQATDSHSLAERVRRERINEKLKLLQDLVPGCYKTMGMAVMLDVIINYVRSLQNQIEFLSMKLSAASMFYDFNSPEAEAMEALQRTNPCEAREMERLMREEGFDQVLASPAPAPAPADHDLHSTWRF